MKKIRIMSAVLVFLCVSLASVSSYADDALPIEPAGRPGSGSGEAAAETQFYTPDYFPLVPGTIWIYSKNGTITEKRRVLNRTATVQGGAEVSVLLSSPQNHRNYYTSDDKGIRYHGTFQGMCDGVVLIPGMTIAPAYAEIGRATESAVYFAWPNCPGVGHGAIAGVVGTSTVEGIETVTVPAGTFETLRISYAGGSLGSGSLYLAKDVGEVKRVEGTSVSELVFTNSGVRDLAITNLTAPSSITFNKKVVKKTVPLKAVIQNRGINPETIEDQAMLTDLITMTAESLGHCPNPLPVLVSTRPRNDFPITLDPKESLTVNYEVTLECVNDPKRTTVGAGHYDYRFTATLNHAVLDGKPDDHPFDDTCPRTVTPPYVIDPYPDGTIKDKGCGKPKSDGTFGGDVLLDIVASVS